MGTEISSDFCDIVLYRVAEKQLLTPENLRAFQIRIFLRFRDDIFIVAGCRNLFRQFFDQFRRCIAGIWLCKVEELSRESVTMLDVEVFISRSNLGCKLDWRPYSKPSKQFIPLALSSAHVPFVHSWPVSQVLRLYRNSSSYSIFQHACAVFVRNLIASFHDGGIIAKVIQRSMSVSSKTSSSMPVCKPVSDRPVLTFVLGYHPGFYNARLGCVVQSVLHDYDEDIQHLFGGDVLIRIAWANTRAPAHLKFRSL